MKRLLFILSLVCFTISVWAEQISREQAYRQAQQFCLQNGKGASLVSAETAMSKARKRSQQVPDYYYVFNVGQDQGYVIVSGDDRTEAILGFSNHGTFDADNIPCNMAAWLQGYADQIKYIQEHPDDFSATRGDVPTHVNIPALISTKWDQAQPYNNLLPSYLGRKCVTGCVTTAMAQIMNYHGAPASCTAIPGYTTESHKIKCEDLPATTFDWANMSSDAEVAKLMKYCAYALEADFDLTGTNVWDDKPGYALTNYFGYGNGIQLAARDNYTETDWDMLIYTELANGRPVLYSGQANNGGHSFVVHGYTNMGGVGYYTVNWGWGGFQDGSYLLSAMTPAGGGIGSGDTSGNGYNLYQTALVGISTLDVTPYQVVETVALTTDEFSLKDSGKEYTIPAGYAQFGPISISYQFSNNLTRTYSFEYNFKVVRDGKFVEMLLPNDPQMGNFPPRYYFSGSYTLYLPNYNGNTNSLGKSFSEPGTYQIIPVSREVGASEWNENKGSDKKFITGVVSSDMKLRLYEGYAPGTEPAPEVTQAQLDELAGLYAVQKAAINEKLSALAGNDAKLTDLAAKLSQMKPAIDAVNAKISAIEKKLKDNYLSADQKQTYGNELDALKTKNSAMSANYSKAVQEQSALLTSSTALSDMLKKLINTINTELAALSSISTTEALNASQTKAAEVTAQQTGCNVSAETAKIKTLESDVDKIILTQIDSDLTTLEGHIDSSIAAAKAAEQEEKEKEAAEKLEAAKKELQEAYDKLMTELRAKQDIINSNEKAIADLEVAAKDAESAIAPVEKKIAAIKESLNNELLSEAEQKKFADELESLDKVKSDYADNLTAIIDKISIVRKKNDQVRSDLQKLEELMNVGKAEVNALTVTDDIDRLKAKSQEIVKQFSGVDASGIEKELLSLRADLDKLSLDDVVKSLASLESDIEKMIAANEEEYEKQQAEKLAKTKENFLTAVGELDDLIKTYKDNGGKMRESLDDMKRYLNDIDDAIATIKDRYSEIEKKLDELIAKQARTRSDASEVIAELQKKLKQLEDNLLVLEQQSNDISEQAGKFGEEIAQFEVLIETASQTSSQSQNSFLSAATIAEVETLTVSVTKAVNTLKSNGVSAYNLCVENHNVLVVNINTLISNINIVNKQAVSLLAEVEAEATGISSVAVDESEVMGRYDMKGNPVDSSYKGIQVIRLKNGKTIKVNVK